VHTAEERRQKLHFCRLPFAVNVMLNLSIIKCFQLNSLREIYSINIFLFPVGWLANGQDDGDVLFMEMSRRLFSAWPVARSYYFAKNKLFYQKQKSGRSRMWKVMFYMHTTHLSYANYWMYLKSLKMYRTTIMKCLVTVAKKDAGDIYVVNLQLFLPIDKESLITQQITLPNNGKPQGW